ncbi:MAG: hypothetical protein O2923_05290 [Verrucomicrobia bacterium]|nr:hypothetical protein [Verrucomicrobiota bacterium]MDA1087554.1 hypothetical protein [Verrucomicrobiota bacterium]
MQPLSELTPSSALRSLFGLLNRSGIAYCVVGMTEDLPEQVEGDIDIVIETTDTESIHTALATFEEETGARLVQVLMHELNARHFIFSWLDEDGMPRFLGPDICGDYHRNGMLLMPAGDILSRRELALDKGGREKEFFVPAPADEFIYYLLKKIDKGQFNDRQAEHLSRVFEANPDGSKQWLEKFWRPPQRRILADAAAGNAWLPVQDSIKSLQRELRGTRSRTWSARRGEWARRIYRLRRPTGIHIVILGPDGSGKSSVVQELGRRLAPAFRRTSFHHFRPHWGRPSFSPDPAATPPHGKPARSWIGSAAKMLYYALDYVIGYACHIYPALVCSTLVIFDRYFDDILIDPARYRYAGPRAWVKMMAPLIPRPDLTFVLSASPEILETRKGELTRDESVRQLDAYRAHSKSRPNVFEIDANQDLDHVVADIGSATLSYMQSRASDRRRR